ncbi:MAG: hypothetical protein ACI8UG_002203 [Gammaproteobacteria bacterium]|jgi:hypothetical protein
MIKILRLFIAFFGSTNVSWRHLSSVAWRLCLLCSGWLHASCSWLVDIQVTIYWCLALHRDLYDHDYLVILGSRWSGLGFASSLVWFVIGFSPTAAT